MGSCLKCTYCNKISGTLTCDQTGRPVEKHDWCSNYSYPFSDATKRTDRIESPLHRNVEYPFSERYYLDARIKDSKNVVKWYCVKSM